ncbi:MAG: hypothetical protein ACKVP2_01220 [Burkholderiales bacterium]
MNDRNVARNFCAFVLAVLLPAWTLGALAQELTPAPVRKERIYVRDLEGIWVNNAYLKELAATKSPHAAARKAPPVVIGIKREGPSYPVVVTNFDRAILRVVLDLEPFGKPNGFRLVLGAQDRPTTSTDATYLPFEGVKGPQGKFETLKFSEKAFMKGKSAEYTRIAGEISPHVNRAVIAGKYADDKGGTWTFAESGEAVWPDQKMNYEISLNDPGASCEYFQSEDATSGEKKRFGFAWKAGKLQILAAKLVNKKVRCDAKPFAVLTPQ